MILEDARAALETGPLCDPCLGRPFAELSHGLRNEERGRALRVAIALADDDPFEPPDECWVCEGLTERFDELAERAAEALADVEFDTYQVGTRLPPLVEENEALVRDAVGRDGETLGSECNREVGRRLGRLTGAAVEFGRPDVQVLCDLDADEVSVQLNSAFVYGRYRKLARDVPQTEWPCSDCDGTGRRGTAACPACDGSGYRYETSVEQLVAPPVCRALRGTEPVFHGAGREDVDAKMLGTGRPFVVEVKHPHRRHVDTAALAREIDEAAEGMVEVEGLRLATHEMVERVKELDAAKTYRMRVRFGATIGADDLAAALATLSGATIEQRTPQRVDHRRADRVRTRRVYDAAGEHIDDRTAEVTVHGEGGLYVKELISGDEGRTAPSLAGLLDVAATVETLDVLAVEGEDESFEGEAFFRAG